MTSNDGRFAHKETSDVTGSAGTECSHAPGPWTWRDVAGAGLQISAVLPAGFKIAGTAREWDGKTSVMTWTVRDQITVQITDERWVQFSTGSWDEMQRANARLIAAAPDLLVALKALELQALQSDVNDPANEWGREALDITRAAIAKATLSTDPSAAPTENFLPSSLNNSLPQSLPSVSKKAGT